MKLVTAAKEMLVVLQMNKTNVEHGFTEPRKLLFRSALENLVVAVAEFEHLESHTIPYESTVVPDALIKLFCNMIDNLSDMPISNEWAYRVSKAGSELLDDQNYFRV